MKQTYIRCPRCELNYILKKDKFCKVCKTEMKALGTLGAEENLDLELCPICKANYINSDEDICAQCAKEKELEEGENTSSKYDGEWGNFNNQEEDEGSYQGDENGDMVSISSLEDTPLTDDDEMELDISGEEDDLVDDEDNEENPDDEDDFDLDDSEDDFEDDDEDDDSADDEDEKPSRKKR